VEVKGWAACCGKRRGGLSAEGEEK
jgi:hypothetical protein